MARNLTLQLLIAITALSLVSATSEALTPEQQDLVDRSLARFEMQGLELPEVEIVFHESLLTCHGHKGLYREKTRTLEMCSLDESTMLHELAHAWANAHLDADDMAGFVDWRGLDSWNDHEHEWGRRGTEHVAETIAWALLEEPNHVRWVETREDGTRVESLRILTLGVDIETLAENFRAITGMDPVFRTTDELAPTGSMTARSPELARLGR